MMTRVALWNRYYYISVRTLPEWTTETHTLLNINRGVLFIILFAIKGIPGSDVNKTVY